MSPARYEIGSLYKNKDENITTTFLVQLYKQLELDKPSLEHQQKWCTTPYHNWNHWPVLTEWQSELASLQMVCVDGFNFVNTIYFDASSCSNQWYELFHHVTYWILSCGLGCFLVTYETSLQVWMLWGIWDPTSSREGGFHTPISMVNSWVHWWWGTCLDYCCSIICHLTALKRKQPEEPVDIAVSIVWSMPQARGTCDWAAH